MEDLIKALQIMLKYGNPQFPTHCEHDVLIISSHINWNNITPEDKAKLQELGFDYSSEYDCITSFTYGSC
jgi:hypothetical protein